MGSSSFSLFPGPARRDQSESLIPGLGSNQFMQFPNLVTPGNAPGGGGAVVPGTVPPASGGLGFPSRGLGPNQPAGYPLQSYSQGLAGGVNTIGPLFPKFTSDLFQFLQQQMGRGATPFDLSSALPSGGTSGPGQLSAPATPVLKQLQDFYSTGTGGPTGTGTLADMAKTGLPINVLPEWQAMLEAMKRPEAEARANLREQFAFTGNLASSPFGRAEADFELQNVLQKQALLGGLESSALEAARGRQLSASESLQGAAQTFGQMMQGLDQDSINRLLAEFVRTRPEYSPYLNMLFAAATTFPPFATKNVGVGAGSVLSGLGTLATGAADIISLIKGK